MTNLRLSTTQRQVVEHRDGAILVVAGPGSGKTRVLTERVRYLLTNQKGHFRVLALTFTNKAANEMVERLDDLGDLKSRAFIGTLHGFCLEMLSDRGKPLGFLGPPQIFEQAADRRQVLLEATKSDPTLMQELDDVGDAKRRNQLLDRWIKAIGYIKAHPVSADPAEDALMERVYDAYNGGLRSSGALDFDDLLLFGHRLLLEYPKIAQFYRRLYRFICVDEAQDLNEAQYCVIKALCGDEFKNVMMVGDPNQSIYGFNTSSPRYMQLFRKEFDARLVELDENYRSSQCVVRAAKKLQPSYKVQGQLPIRGAVNLLIGDDEAREAKLVVGSIRSLLSSGHEDIEGPLTTDRIAVLGRTRYTLLEIERQLASEKIPFYRRVSSAHEFESYEMKEFLLGLRVIANPRDQFHFRALAKTWDVNAKLEWHEPSDAIGVSGLIEEMAQRTKHARSKPIAQAIRSVALQSGRLGIRAPLNCLREHADGLPDEARGSVYGDIAVLMKEWDGYLRSSPQASRSISAFMSSMALGVSQGAGSEGVALLSVHASKGMEFDVVYVVGMADGIFPDFRARGNKSAIAEERRNAFVAVTRSRRLLYLSYPRTRKMPWGDIWDTRPSEFLYTLGVVG